MANRFKKGCGIGCLSVLVVSALALGGTWYGLERHYSRAWEKRQQLELQHGPRSDFHPGAGPVFTAAELERFLAVRQALAPVCIQATTNNARMLSLQQFDDQEEVPKGLILKQALVSISGTFGTSKGLGDFALARNQALLAADMGYGQYTWLYVMTYYAGLGQKPILGMGDNRPGNLAHGAREAILGMMASRADSLRVRAAGLAGDQASLRAGILSEVEVWLAEREAMITDRSRLPFAGGAPACISRVIEPYREDLLAYFCPATDALEMLRIKEHGVGYEDR